MAQLAQDGRQILPSSQAQADLPVARQAPGAGEDEIADTRQAHEGLWAPA
jgi:hypothetical protein